MSVESNIVSYANDLSAQTATDSADRIAHIKLSHCVLPLAMPVSDAKVLTGRQKPMTEIAFIFARSPRKAARAASALATANARAGRGCLHMRKRLHRMRLAKMRTTSPNSGRSSCGLVPAWGAVV